MKVQGIVNDHYIINEFPDCVLSLGSPGLLLSSITNH